MKAELLLPSPSPKIGCGDAERRVSAQLFCFYALSILFFSLLNQCFGEWMLSFSSSRSVLISGQAV
jgi:hypothetical protein